MNTKRFISVVMILGLMATNMAQAFADTVVTSDTTGNTTTIPTAKADRAAERAKIQADRAAERAKNTADRAAAKAKRQADKAAKSAVDLACMQTAIAARETAVVSSFDTYFTDFKTALSSRMDALKAAWALTDATARRAAIQKAWSDFNAAFKTDHSTLNTSRKAAWDKFKADGQACHASSTEVTDTTNDKSN